MFRLPLVRQPFDGEDLRSLGFERRVDAGVDALPIDEDGAGSAFGLVAADLRAGQAQVIAQDFGEKATVEYVQRMSDAVDDQVQVGHRLMAHR